MLASRVRSSRQFSKNYGALRKLDWNFSPLTVNGHKSSLHVLLGRVLVYFGLAIIAKTKA